MQTQAHNADDLARFAGGRLLALQLSQLSHDAPQAPLHRVSVVLGDRTGDAVWALRMQDVQRVDWRPVQAGELACIETLEWCAGRLSLRCTSGWTLRIEAESLTTEVL